ncbi:MAG: hypothetical protein ACLFPJ_01840 [Candidatus Woesearchaeota archaeon]
MEICKHEFRYFDAGIDTDNTKYWLFYCTKCLELKQVQKNETFRYLSDLK